MKGFIRTFEKIFESTGRGFIYIDEAGLIRAFSILARKATGIIYESDNVHEAGKIEDGDVVVIADNEIGNDDDMTLEDLEYIGIKDDKIEMGNAFLAVGTYSKDKHAGTKGCDKRTSYKYASHFNPNSEFALDYTAGARKIRASIDFGRQKLSINIDGETYSMSYFEAVGHMVVIDGRNGKVKFFQARGYGYRREEIGKLLRGKRFVAKLTEGNHKTEKDGIIGSPYAKSIFGDELTDLISELLKSDKDEFFDGIFEIYKRWFYCDVIRSRQWSKYDGVYVIIMDASSLENLAESRSKIIERLEEYQRAKMKPLAIECSVGSFGHMAGKTPEMLEVKHLASRASKGKFNVLITGESGTGKTRLAREIHDLSGSSGPFVEVNCSAIPPNLFESELFGYVGGSFTGALAKGRIGYFEEANGGTIFLDEIGEILPASQVKLLQVLQSKKMYRIGSTKPIDVDVRVIAATNMNIKEAVEKGEFRNDLYYRLNVFPIFIPPLRDRAGDLRELADMFLKRACREGGVENKRLSEGAYDKIMRYSWPGNVRELENAIMRAVAICETPVIYEDYLFLEEPEHEPDSDTESFAGKKYVQGLTLRQLLEATESSAIRDALKEHKGNSSEAIKALGMSKTAFYEKVKKYGIRYK